MTHLIFLLGINQIKLTFNSLLRFNGLQKQKRLFKITSINQKTCRTKTHDHTREHNTPTHKPEEKTVLQFDPMGVTPVLSSIMVLTLGMSSILLPIHQ